MTTFNTGGPAPRINLLGAVELSNATGSCEDTKRNRLTELAAYLALHPGASKQELVSVLFPDSMHPERAVHEYVSRLRTWLGDPSHLESSTLTGGSRAYRISGVTSDWEQFQALVGKDPSAASTQDLEAALSLVRGRPFETPDSSNRYRWAFGGANAPALLIDQAISRAAAALARQHIASGHFEAATRAAALGIFAAGPSDELADLVIEALHKLNNPPEDGQAATVRG